MSIVTTWRWAFWDPTTVVALAVVAVLVVWAAWNDRRRRVPAWPLSAALRLGAVAWFGAGLLGLELWRDESQPKPGRYSILVDRTASVALRPALAARIEGQASELAAALRAHGRVELLAYTGAQAEPRWRPLADTPITRAGGPTRLVEDLDRLPADAQAADVVRVLISDGAEASFADASVPSTLAVALVVLPEHRTDAADVELVGVEADAYALVRSPLRLIVTARRAPGGPASAEVRVRDEAMDLGGGKVSFAAGAATAVTSVDVLPTVEGHQVFTVEITANGRKPDPRVQRARIAVRVIRDRIRLLHVVGRPDWDSRLLRELLAGDPTVELVSFQILRTPEDRPGTRSDDELSLIPFPTRELFTIELPKFDVVVFQNFNYEPYFEPDFRHLLLQNLRSFVVRDGGGFVMTAGDLSFGYGRYQSTPIAEILPVLWTGIGQWLPGSDRVIADRAWGPWFRADPPAAHHSIDRVYAASPRPGARVVWRSGDEPVVVVQAVGRGRSAALLTDRLWRAAAMGGSADRAAVATLWSRLIRYVAGDPEFAEYHVAWQQPVVAPGGRIEGVLRPATDVAEVALVDRAGHVVTGATLADGRVRAEAPTTDATLYLALDGTRAPEPVIVELPLAERTGTDVDRRAWLRWSDRVGARVETLEDFDARAAAKRLAERARTVIRRDVTSVTDLRLYWLIGLALLLADFSVRRLAGEP